MDPKPIVKDIAYIIPSPDGSWHFLYLKDGRIVKIDPEDGTIDSLCNAPDYSDIEQFEDDQVASRRGAAAPAPFTGGGTAKPGSKS